MLYTRLAAAALLSASAAVVDGAPTNGTKTAHFKTQKVVPKQFADPGLVHDGERWYAFATNNGESNVRVATSDDFSTWTVKDGWDALPHAGPWTAQPEMHGLVQTVGDLLEGRWPWSNAPPAVWAPDVQANDAGQYVLYYSATKAGDKPRHCIGVAVGSSPEGPYTAQPEPFACHDDQGGAIDPAGFKDEATGKRYVVYKVDGNNAGNGGLCGNTKAPQVPTPIMLQQVDADDGHTKIGEPRQILDRGAADGPLVEAPYLFRTDAGRYVLFFSSNCYSTDLYDIGYAFADAVDGPYTKAGPFAVTGVSGLKAPGGATVSHDGKHMVFHAADEDGNRAMYTADLSFTEDRATKAMKVVGSTA